MAANNDSFPLQLFDTLIRQNYSYGAVFKKMKISDNSDVKDLFFYSSSVGHMICMEKDPMYAKITVKNQDQFLSELRKLWEELKRKQKREAERFVQLRIGNSKKSNANTFQKKSGDRKVGGIPRRIKQYKVRKVKALQQAKHIPKSHVRSTEELEAWRKALRNMRNVVKIVDGKDERRCKRCNLVIRF